MGADGVDYSAETGGGRGEGEDYEGRFEGQERDGGGSECHVGFGFGDVFEDVVGFGGEDGVSEEGEVY